MSSRQPRLILRESCIDDVTDAWPPGAFLEVGAGTGYMTRKFLKRGFHGVCYDLGEESRNRLRQNLLGYQGQISVVNDLSILAPDTFDYLFAFEVLEHIPDDLAALQQWTRCLKPGARILLSVPAHARKYGKSDEMVGHVRRYERAELNGLLVSAGYRDIQMVNYGFPVTEFTRTASNLLIARECAHLNLTPEERSTRSSFSRPRHIRRILGYLHEGWFRPFMAMQRVFYKRDWGDGLVATAYKD